MKFQINNILLYGKNGKIRTIELKQNAVNIITGPSQTGKSALIHIVDYCLGGSECNVCAGIIRNYVDWYAIKLYTLSGELFIARRNPDLDKKSSEDIYFEIGESIRIPSISQLKKNTNLNTLVTSILNPILGIEKYSFEPKEGQTRKTGFADIGKALYFCFQGQNEIDNQKILFHRQSEPFLFQNISDYLPYFLGAISEEIIQSKTQLRNLKRKLKQKDQKKLEHNKIITESFSIAFSLMNEAKDVGLINVNETLPETLDGIQQLFNEALYMNIDNDPVEPDIDILNDLLDRQQRIREQYRSIANDLKSMKDLKYSSNMFVFEINEQKSRLESINIFKHDSSINLCPLCSSPLTIPLPSAEAIQTSLAEINSQLKAVSNDTPHLDEMIAKAEDRLIDIKKELDEINASISSLQVTNQHISEFRDFKSKQAMIKGRLSLYLENIPSENQENSDDELESMKLKDKISNLESKVNDETVHERLDSMLSLISNQITRLANTLRIEHSNSPLRLDIKKLTIVADDAAYGPIPMSKMGSGETWVSLHIVTHLALHNWFINKQCKVPQFLFLDQPSQAYFPPDTSAETIYKQLKEINSDRNALIRMFKLIVNETKNFQVIITEHADIKEKWYQDLICENWWDGNKKLVPVEWIDAE